MKSGYKKSKWTIESIKQFVDENGDGDILISQEYIGWHKKHEFQCHRCNERYFITVHSFVSGVRCGRCRYIRIAETRRFSFEYVKKFFEENGNGDILISGKYINSHAKLDVRCQICGEVYKISFDNFRLGKRHRPCALKKAGLKHRVKIEYIAEYAKSQGCILVSTEYHGATEKLDFICSCGRPMRMNWSNFSQGQRCKQCAIEKTANSRRTSFEEVKTFVESRGCILLSEEYSNNSTPLDIIFACGHSGKRVFAHFKQSATFVCPRCAGKQQYTIEEARELFEDNGYFLISKEYSNCKQKLEFSDGEDYHYSLTLDQFNHNVLERKSLPSRFDVGNPFSLENVGLYLLRYMPSLHLAEGQKWQGNNKKMVFYDDDGYWYTLVFTCLPQYVASNSTPRKVDVGNDFSLHNIEHWLELNNKPFHLVEGQTYKGATQKLLFKCHNCPEEEIPFSAPWSQIFSGRGCGICVSAQIGKFNNLAYLYPEIAAEWNYEKNFPVTPNKIASKTSDKYYWTCPDCGMTYCSTVNHRTTGGRGCPYCTESTGEKKFRKELIKANIYYKTQYRFDDCRDILSLPFDFYLPEFHALVEINGQQHYESVEHFGGEEGFKRRQYHDEIKKNYCEKNKIPLLIIPYWDFKKIPQILSEFVESLRNKQSEVNEIQLSYSINNYSIIEY